MGAIKTATIQSGIEPVLPGAPTRLAVCRSPIYTRIRRQFFSYQMDSSGKNRMIVRNKNLVVFPLFL